jgi:hypothetical protein
VVRHAAASVADQNIVPKLTGKDVIGAVLMVGWVAGGKWNALAHYNL